MNFIYIKPQLGKLRKSLNKFKPYKINWLKKENSSAKLLGLDHLRALAIIMVFFFHYGTLFPHPKWVYLSGILGWTGVNLFFVLSGYLISSKLFEEVAKSGMISWRDFFIKRVFRIFPLFFLIVALYAFFPYLREAEPMGPIWRYLTFTQNFLLDIRNSGTFIHAWSLCVEEQFYLVLPVLVLILLQLKIFKTGGFYLLITLFVLGFLIRYYSYNHYVQPYINTPEFFFKWGTYIYYPTYCQLDGLIFGVSIAAIFQFLPNLRDNILKYGNILFFVSVVLVCATFLLNYNRTLVGSMVLFPIVDFSMAIMVLSALSPNCFLYTMRSSFTSQVATYSYSAYLFHKMMIHVVQANAKFFHLPQDGTLIFILSALSTFLVSIILNRIIERPFLKLRNKALAMG